MSLPRSLLEHDAMIYPTIFLYWHKTDLMIPKRDTKIAKSDIQGWINVTDYRKSSLQKCDISVIFCWLEWAEVINIFPSHHNKRRLEVHISIFLYFTTIWSGPAARRERRFISGGREGPDAPSTSPLSGWQLNYCRDLFSLQIILLQVYAPSLEKSLEGKKSMSIIVSD